MDADFEKIMKDFEDKFGFKNETQAKNEVNLEIELNKILNFVYKNQVKMKNEDSVREFVEEWIKK